MAGLSEEHVTQFVDMGFPRDKVVSVAHGGAELKLIEEISTLKKMNYRGNNITNVHPSTVSRLATERDQLLSA